MKNYFVFKDKTTFDYIVRNSNDIDFQDYISMPDYYKIVYEGSQSQCRDYVKNKEIVTLIK